MAHEGSGFAWRDVTGVLALVTRRRHGRQQEERQQRQTRPRAWQTVLRSAVRGCHAALPRCTCLLGVPDSPLHSWTEGYVVEARQLNNARG